MFKKPNEGADVREPLFSGIGEIDCMLLLYYFGSVFSNFFVPHLAQFLHNRTEGLGDTDYEDKISS